MIKKLFFILLCLTYLSTSQINAKSEMLPHDFAAVISLKTLNYDRSFDVNEEAILISIIFTEEYTEYANSLNTSFEQLTETKTIRNKNFRTNLISLKDLPKKQEELETTIKELNTKVLFILSPKTGTFDNLIEIADNNRIKTFSTLETLKNAGIGTIISTENNKPKLIVNQSKLKDQGNDYSGKLLSLCQIIK